jgi:hypothetical protein
MSAWIQTIAAIVLIALGALWSLQGAGYLAGSFMSGDRTWLIIGAVLLAAGVVLLVRVAARRR